MKKIMVMMLVSLSLLAGCQSAEEGNVPTDSNVPVDTSSVESKALGYQFMVNGTAVGIDVDIATVIDGLGEESSYFEATSCAFEGIDKTYSYGSYQITTYPTDGMDYVGNITLLDDLVKTQEGISVYMDKEDVIAAYGEEGESANNSVIYTKDNMDLVFIFDRNTVVGIEYRSKVLQ